MEGAIIIEDDSAKTPEAIKHEIAVDSNYLSQVDTWVNNWEQKDYCCTGKWNQEETFKLKRQAVEL